jgi:membrane associated rhomboid family serine protease
MNRYSLSPDNEPVMWLRGYALYAAHMIVLGFVVTMILTTILMGTGAVGVLSKLSFTSAEVWRGELWRLFTYGLVNPPTLSFVIEMFMIVIFGRELEKFFGRRAFLTLYGCLYLLSPLVFTALGPWLPMSLAGATGAFALFIAFTALYPNAVMLFNLLAKWVAVALVGLYTLIHFSQQNVTGLLSLWITIGFAFAFVRYEQGRLTLPSFPKSPAKSAPRAVKPSASKPPVKVTPAITSEVDAILDKIARDGFQSLTPAERAKLDQSSEALLKKRSDGRR